MKRTKSKTQKKKARETLPPHPQQNRKKPARDLSPINYTVQEAAQVMGIGVKLLYKMLKNNELEYIVIHGRYQVPPDSIAEYMQAQRVVKNNDVKLDSPEITSSNAQ